MTPPSVSVVVCAYTEDRWDAISAALTSVRAQSLPAHEVILVVDHNDELLRRSRAAYAPGVRVMASAGAPGLSGARNTGVAAVSGEVVAFLDDDAVADRDWLACLTRPYIDPLVMGAGGTAEPVWPGDGVRPRWLPREFDWVVGCSYTGLPEVPTDVRNFLGANMSFRRGAFDVAGGFSEAVGRVGTRPVGCEETEFCIRLRQIKPGIRLLHQPDAVVHHHVSPPRTHWGYFRSRCFSEGLSKGLVSRMVGARDGLDTERSYVRSVLPRAVTSSVRQAVADRDPSGLLRAGNVFVGFGVTAIGYLVMRLRRTGRDRVPRG
jgi:cellulose synthase/poly-beta-1,6-N-acetylglucosamine synthase-like glycosyltransferase